VCAYYTPFKDQPNSTVLTNATVTQILFAQTLAGGKIRAAAVEYVSNGQTHQVPVGREVIISAGTIGTPKVMELSGVGNAMYVYFLQRSGMTYILIMYRILAAASMKQVIDLPTVGENMAGMCQALSYLLTKTHVLFYNIAQLDYVHSRANSFTNVR
jgi:hypothetical protein